MKKRVLFIILIVVLIAVIALGIFFSLINKEKVSITAIDFKNYMEEKGYIVSDATNQFEEYSYIKQVYLAVASNLNYQIEFYELSDDNYANSFYENNRLIFENSKGNTATETNISLKNYSKYVLYTNNTYKVLSRIDNTVIYVNVDATYENDVKNILDELGY